MFHSWSSRRTFIKTTSLRRTFIKKKEYVCLGCLSLFNIPMACIIAHMPRRRPNVISPCWCGSLLLLLSCFRYPRKYKETTLVSGSICICQHRTSIFTYLLHMKKALFLFLLRAFKLPISIYSWCCLCHLPVLMYLWPGFRLCVLL